MTYEEYVELRDKKKVTDSEVSRATGIDKSILSYWKKGRSCPKQDKIDRLNAYFNLFNEIKTIKPINAEGIIDVETQMLLRNDMLHKLLLAGGKVIEEHPEVIEAMIYTLNKMGDRNEV